MELSDCKLLIIYGGSFDPPHWAHIRLPMLVREKLGADAVAYVPAGRPPHKRGRKLTAAAHRLRMLQLALEYEHEHRSIILTDEIERSRENIPSFTIDTIKIIQNRIPPHCRMRLLIGSDQLRIWRQWKSYTRIEKLAEPIVMVRPPHTAETILKKLPPGMNKIKWQTRLLDVPPIDISATIIRKRITLNKTIDQLVPPPVALYINTHHLYV